MEKRFTSIFTAAFTMICVISMDAQSYVPFTVRMMTFRFPACGQRLGLNAMELLETELDGVISTSKRGEYRR